MKICKYVLVGILVTSILGGGAKNSYAEDDARTTTTGEVTFIQDESETGPLDPSNPDPENPIIPDEPNGTPGPLSIDYVSQFRFGSQFISGRDKTYNVILDTVTVSGGGKEDRPTFVQVTDNRGTNAGWKLQVQQGAQFTAIVDDEAVNLKGAEISMTNSQIITTGDNKAEAPTPNAEIILTPGTDEVPGDLNDVLGAKADEGMATWINTFGTIETGEESVTLSVPGISSKAKDAKYTTKLIWVLSDTPA